MGEKEVEASEVGFNGGVVNQGPEAMIGCQSGKSCSYGAVTDRLHYSRRAVSPHALINTCRIEGVYSGDQVQEGLN